MIRNTIFTMALAGFLCCSCQNGGQGGAGEGGATSRKRLEALEERLDVLENQVIQPMKKMHPFSFVLEVDEHGYADDSWNRIIEQGQKIQETFWKKGEAHWGKQFQSPSGSGWLGTEVTPVISIVCVEPEYFFHDTARLPGRFQVTCPSRWGSMLRFFGDGQRVVRDEVVYGMATQAPIGIYVEPGTEVGEMSLRAFEQGIENVIIAAMNGVLPVYLAMDQDRFWMDRVKILQHQGAVLGIKHGPVIRPDWYPVIQREEGNVWLKDARFTNLQLEGPHTNQRPQAAMFLSGASIIISRISIYGWMQGPYLHSDRGLVMDSLTMFDSEGKYCRSEEMIPYIVSQSGAKPSATISLISAPTEGWYLPKGSMVPQTKGWHQKGEHTF